MAPGYGRLVRMVQSPAAVVIFILVSGLLQAIYWIRQGGDFMHGRVLLTPLFCLLTPIAVIPVVLPDGTRMARGAGYLFVGATTLAVVRGSGMVAVGGQLERAWAATPPASRTRASSTSGASTLRPRATHTR